MRRFNRLLIHRCTLVYGGKVVGQDAYGRDIKEDVKYEGIPCRADRINQSRNDDETGIDYVVDYLLFFSADDIEISLDVKVTDVVDREGNEILLGTFSIDNFNPIYRKESLHHYEVTLRRM